MKKIIFSGIFLLVAVAVLFSCKDEDYYKKARQEELQALKEYLAKNYPDLEPTASGLYYIEKKKGSGDTIKIGDRVQLFYKVMDLDSFLIDETPGYTSGYYYEPFEVTIGASGSIQGLQEGLTYMQPGSRASLIINSELAYGQDGSGLVLPFMTLLMDVEVYKVFPLKTSN